MHLELKKEHILLSSLESLIQVLATWAGDVNLLLTRSPDSIVEVLVKVKYDKTGQCTN